MSAEHVLIAHFAEQDTGRRLAPRPRLPSVVSGILLRVAGVRDENSVEHHFALAGIMLGGGEMIEERARERVNELNCGVADEAPAAAPVATAAFIASEICVPDQFAVVHSLGQNSHVRRTFEVRRT